ncbi:MAG TPA: carboxypeptidase-like regulatory domain-containing protein [Pirellulales bacterium]|nr:carboxypeptidase-like regulatory domain-containing protein [Pirellulales bacterium]
MKTIRSIQWTATITAVVAMISAQPLYAAVNQPGQKSAIADISLLSGGLLEGKLIDPRGRPIKESSVAIFHDGLKIASTTTTGDGAFKVAGLHGGIHQIVAETGTTTCRFWEPGTSPPAAGQAALVVSQNTPVRGQPCATGCVPNCATKCQTVCEPATVATPCSTSPSPQCNVAAQPNNCNVPAQPNNCNVPAQSNTGVRRVQYQEPLVGTVQGPPAQPYTPVGLSGIRTWGPQVSFRNLLIGAGIAAAIAIPVAISNSKSGS